MNHTLQFTYGWADVYTKPKYQKYPDWLHKAWKEKDRCYAEVKLLLMVEPLPKAELEVAMENSSIAERHAEKMWHYYCEVPVACEECGGGIMAYGDDMKCSCCGLDYTPDWDEIPY